MTTTPARQLAPFVSGVCPTCHSPNMTFAVLPTGLECGGCGSIHTLRQVERTTVAAGRSIQAR